MEAVIDTRFFIAHFLAEDRETINKTRRILEDLQKEDSRGIIPTIVIHELYKFEMEKLGREVADIRINAILKSKLKIMDLDSQKAIEAAQLRFRYTDLPMADAIIAATAIRSSSDLVLTDDIHIKQIKEIKTKWI